MTGIYLIIDFNWPEEITEEMAKGAAHLHKLTLELDWIKDVVAAAGGIGSGLSCTWVFWLENYGALDKLLKDYESEICKTYLNFFKSMAKMKEKIREEVQFL